MRVLWVAINLAALYVQLRYVPAMPLPVGVWLVRKVHETDP